LRSVTFFLAAAMIIAGIIFVAVGIITSGLRESLSTWKFITGAACFAFGGVCAAIYAFSQGETPAGAPCCTSMIVRIVKTIAPSRAP